MLVRDWMSTKLITIDENESITKAMGIIKDHKIRRLPVVKDDKLIGMVTDRDLKEATPSKVSTLDIHELYGVLSKIKVKDIMSKSLITIGPDESVEKAAVIMLENKISGLPVVQKDALVGVITQTDVFRVLTGITGIYRGGIKIALELPEVPGTTQSAVNIIRSHGGRIISVLTSHDISDEEHRQVFVRTVDVEGEKLDQLLQELGKSFKILYTVQDEIE